MKRYMTLIIVLSICGCITSRDYEKQYKYKDVEYRGGMLEQYESADTIVSLQDSDSHKPYSCILSTEIDILMEYKWRGDLFLTYPDSEKRIKIWRYSDYSSLHDFRIDKENEILFFTEWYTIPSFGKWPSGTDLYAFDLKNRIEVGYIQLERK